MDVAEVAQKSSGKTGKAGISGDLSAYPKRQYFEQLRSRMDLWRSSFISHWRDLAQYLQPYRQQFTITDTNRGERRNLSIIDSTATLASRNPFRV